MKKAPKSDDMMILAKILAVTDATFWPMRNWDGRLPAVTYERRQKYRKGGCTWSAARFGGGTTDVDRKAISRVLQTLGLNELVSTGTGSSSRTATVRLTPHGDAIARVLCGLQSLSQALPIVRKAICLSNEPDAFENNGLVWVRETALTDCQWGDPEHVRKLSDLQESLIPALVAGLVDSNSDVAGRTWYAAMLPANKLDLPKIDSIQFSSEARRIYLATFRAEKGAIESAVPDDSRQIGMIPIPVSPMRRQPAVQKAAM
jgi:hypothetical protein